MPASDIVKHFKFATHISYPAIAFMALLINSTQCLSYKILINPFVFLYQSFTFKLLLIFAVGCLLLKIRFANDIGQKDNKNYFLVFLSSILFIQCYYAAKYNAYVLHNIIISMMIAYRIYCKMNESDIIDYTRTKGLFVYLYKNRGELCYKTYRNVLCIMNYFIVYYISYRMTYYIIFGLIGYSHIKDIRTVMDHVLFYSELIVTIFVYFIYYELINMVYCYNISLKCKTRITKMPNDIFEIRFYMFQKIKACFERKCFDNMLRDYFIIELRSLKYLLGEIDLELEKSVFYNGVKIPSVGEKSSLWKKINFTEKLRRRKKISEKLKKDMIKYYKIVKIIEEMVSLVDSINDRSVTRSLYQNERVILIEYVKERSIKLEEMYLIDLKSEFLQLIDGNQ